MKLSWFIPKTLINVFRLTPIRAIILAPVALYSVILLWGGAVLPVHEAVWNSDALLKLRLGVDDPAIRIAAVKDAGSWSAADVALLDQLVTRLNTDESRPVRNAAAFALGQLGARRPLPAEAIQALTALVLHEKNDSLLSAAMTAVGQSATYNRYSYAVTERIANISAEDHFTWVYPQAATALGRIGAARPLSAPLFARMNVSFSQPRADGEREHLAAAFVEMAKGRPLPTKTLNMLARAFAGEPNRNIRTSILYALAHSAADYRYALTLNTSATRDRDPEIAAAARHGLRIIESNRHLEKNDPLSVAMNESEPVDTRLKALHILRGARIDSSVYGQIVSLAGDPETRIAAAAVEMFHWLASSADNEFDQHVLVPALSRAMADADPIVRYAAYGELTTISRNEPEYLRAGGIPVQLEFAANDPDPRVRVVILLMMQRDDAQRLAVIERGLNDPDSYVRSNAASWLSYAREPSEKRQALHDRALQDPNPDVRQSALAAQQAMGALQRTLPAEIRRLWQRAEHGQVHMKILVAVTVVMPILIGGIFLVYFVVRLVTYLQQRRWRFVAAIPVVAAWTAASYGLYLLYIAAGRTAGLDGDGIVDLAEFLWVMIGAYAALGWLMHYAVRR